MCHALYKCYLHIWTVKYKYLNILKLQKKKCFQDFIAHMTFITFSSILICLPVAINYRFQLDLIRIVHALIQSFLKVYSTSKRRFLHRDGHSYPESSSPEASDTRYKYIGIYIDIMVFNTGTPGSSSSSSLRERGQTEM